MVFGAYVEAFYQWNFNEPSNQITNYRGFDNRHNTFTLANLALDVQWDYQRLIGRLTLQVGHTPSTYYLAEPSRPGAAGANATDAELWKYVQQAYAGYRFPLGRGLTIAAGVFLSPTGPEAMAVKDNWNWSRANLFFGLPFYHTGVRATYAVSRAWAFTLAGYNGWNSVVDNNSPKSLSGQATYTGSDVALSLLYFGGVERPDRAPEGHAFRHMLDTHVTWHAASWLSLIAHANGGVEPNAFGLSAWGASALYARLRVLEPLYLSGRGDFFYEHAASDADGTAARIFWPANWVSSGTLTANYRPHERVSFQLEVRHDQAQKDMYFGGHVPSEDGHGYVANRRTQNTITCGVTSWL